MLNEWTQVAANKLGGSSNVMKNVGAGRTFLLGLVFLQTYLHTHRNSRDPNPRTRHEVDLMTSIGGPTVAEIWPFEIFQHGVRTTTSRI